MLDKTKVLLVQDCSCAAHPQSFIRNSNRNFDGWRVRSNIAKKHTEPDESTINAQNHTSEDIATLTNHIQISFGQAQTKLLILPIVLLSAIHDAETEAKMELGVFGTVRGGAIQFVQWPARSSSVTMQGVGSTGHWKGMLGM